MDNDLPQHGDPVSAALRGLHSKAVDDQRRALDIIEKVADDDPIACDLLRRNGCTNLLIRLARSSDVPIADRAAAALSSMCGEATKGERQRSVAIGDLKLTLHELSYVQVGVGFKTWFSAPALVALLQSGELNVNDMDILELGCGTGLVGIAAGLLGARSVVMTDYLPEIVRNAHANARANGLSERVSTAILDWTTAPPIDPAGTRSEGASVITNCNSAAPTASASEDPAQAACRPHIWTRYHLILAADVVYATELVSPLIYTIAASLSSRGRAHVMLPSPTVRFCIADFEKQASVLFSVQKRAIKGQDGDDVNYYTISWPANEST